MKVPVQYDGKRFPRVVSLKNGEKIAFRPDRKVLELDMYDAMLLLKSNIRKGRYDWEFTIPTNYYAISNDSDSTAISNVPTAKLEELPKKKKGR